MYNNLIDAAHQQILDKGIKEGTKIIKNTKNNVSGLTILLINN